MIGSLVGTYVSEDSQHTLVITSSLTSNGSFVGTFTTNTTVGQITYQIPNGQWRFPAGNSNVAGLVLAGTSAGGSGSDACSICDSWAGSVTTNPPHNFLMNGSRSLTTAQTTQQMFSFERVNFIKQ
jgi:hypothetical protein